MLQLFLALGIGAWPELLGRFVCSKVLPLSQIDMIFFTAISTILTLFLSVWCLIMTRRPRNWRLWWMSHLRQIDMNSTSEERRHQDGIFRTFVLIACILSVLATAWGGYWTWAQWSEGRQLHAGHVNDAVFIEQDAATAKSESRNRPGR